MNNGNHEDIRKKMESEWPKFAIAFAESLSLAETDCTCTYAAMHLTHLSQKHLCTAVKAHNSVLAQLEDCRLARKKLR